MLVTQGPLPFAVSDVRVASVTGHKERASGIYVGGRIASFHGLACWGRLFVHLSSISGFQMFNYFPRLCGAHTAEQQTELHVFGLRGRWRISASEGTFVLLCGALVII